MRAVFVTSEVAPFSKTGGLGDVTAALPAALGRLGVDVSVITPAYSGVLNGPWRLERLAKEVGAVLAGQQMTAAVLRAEGDGGVPVYFIDAPTLFAREHLYGTATGDYPDNWLRFGFFCKAAFQVIRRYGLNPDIVHAHDWQTGLIPFFSFQDYQGFFNTLLTVHNVGYQGLFAADVIPSLGIEQALFTPASIEFWGQLSFLKAGLMYAARITTVSPTHAAEVRRPEFGRGLEGVFEFRRDQFSGILNGIDEVTWDPRRDAFLPAGYSCDDLAGKRQCKQQLQTELGLPVRADLPLIGLVGRLTEQKGWDLLLEVLDDLFRQRACQMVALGTGDAALEAQLQKTAARYTDRLAVRIGFDEGLAHRIQAGSDLFLMPSRYEPCGLNQLYAMRYGTIPVVHAVGGLKDSVQEGPDGTGFCFAPFEFGTLLAALDRALDTFEKPFAWQALIQRAMVRDSSWATSARAYLDLYRQILEEA